MGERMQGRIALVTGSTTGIGRSVAELFASEGASVAVSGRTVERGEKVAQRIRDAGGDAEFFQLDIADESSVASVMSQVADRFGGLTTLINNAAPTAVVSQTIKPMAELSTEEWEAIITTGLTGSVFWCTKYAWPHLVEADQATIVNMSSGAAMHGTPGLSAYAASKGGLNSATRVIAAEGQAVGIRCNAIIVGRVVSGRSDSGELLGDLAYIGNPMQIATAALFLATEESSFMNADLITVDGGASMLGSGG
jgi:NAD(P)-dependent dehydrogenase (short-subunit alcohol dehydrogenase family)